MAETYLTPTFQNATKPPAAPAPAAAAPAAAAPAPDQTPAQTGGEQYQTDTFKKAVGGGQTQQQAAPVIAPSPAAPPAAAPDLPGSPRNPRAPMPAPSAPRQTPPPAPPPADWSIDWSKGGEVKLPQSVQDWSTVAAQNSLMGLYPGLTAQADAARKRLDPVTAGSADVAGGAISPTTLLNAVPGGPILAGAAHEGIKSAVTNWTPDESWTDYLKRVGEDTAGGAAAGLAGQGAGWAAAKALPEVIKGGVTGGAAYLGHKMLGGWAGGDLLKEAPGLLGLYKGMDSVANWAGEKGKDLISSPAAQQAIKNLILGGGSAARQYAGPYDQWIPGQ
jgi:hypothetical protein